MAGCGREGWQDGCVHAHLVAEGSKHERCPPTLVSSVDSKHHGEVLQNAVGLSHGCSHVQWVGVVGSAA